VYAGLLDYNGDGLTDILWLATDNSNFRNWALWQGQGDGTFKQVSIDTTTAPNDHSAYFIDISGDGKTDIVWDKVDTKGLSLGPRRLWLGKGDGTFIEQTNLGGKDGTLTGYRAYLADFNGDGLPDILWVQETGGTTAESLERTGTPGTSGPSAPSRVLWLGKGDGTFTEITNFANLDGQLAGYVPIIADFNGDGKADILWDSRTGTDTRSTGTRVLWLSDGVSPDLMTSVHDGARRQGHRHLQVHDGQQRLHQGHHDPGRLGRRHRPAGAHGAGLQGRRHQRHRRHREHGLHLCRRQVRPQWSRLPWLPPDDGEGPADQPHPDHKLSPGFPVHRAGGERH
jgi:hypothetical protein